MNKFSSILFLLFASLSLISVKAQNGKSVEPRISEGIVNGKAISLPKPIYPEEARKSGLNGTINVNVSIDENGNVILAKAVSGIENAEIRKAAEEAAMKAKFSPTILSGKAVKVTGIIVYNFVNDKSNEEKLKVLGVTTFLYILRYYATDLQEFNKTFGSDKVIAETIDEFSAYRTELTPLLSLEKIPLENRVLKVDEVISAFKAKLNASETWQYEVGKDFMNVIHSFAAASKGEEKFDEAAVKEHLSRIKRLIPTAPDDFPKDVLQKLNDVADFSNKSLLISPENIQDFQNKMFALFETISPGSTK